MASPISRRLLPPILEIDSSPFLIILSLQKEKVCCFSVVSLDESHPQRYHQFVESNGLFYRVRRTNLSLISGFSITV
ncbi:hypothetical protein L6452_00405 [Arctium lappa]|uniref:Uncharacterized protein n=1 Tax=Arctium lappa TaxID=4217 RepID=A0ACB9FDE7_ARCLA|nr:hypothetical protein L6452_00405 [Arctium lappa]